MKNVIEEMQPEKEWFEQARRQTIETLPDFMNRLMNDYCHDYGTVCHAVAACALAAVYAANHSENGGITGFQASLVMWDIIRQMNYSHNKCGLKIVDYDEMLYPQYAYKFEKTIAPDTWKALQEAAEKKIEQDSEFAHPEVLKHWKSIADGNVPFGYQVEEAAETEKKCSFGWISVNDKLPDKSGNYLVFVGGTTENMMYSKKHRAWNADDLNCHKKYEITTVTHWMPLPEPPESTGG